MPCCLCVFAVAHCLADQIVRFVPTCWCWAAVPCCFPVRRRTCFLGRCVRARALTLGRAQPPQLKPFRPLPPVCSSWLCIALSAPLGVLCVSALSPCCLACARIWRTVRSFCAAAWVPRACWPGASRFIWFDRVRLVLCVLWFRVEPHRTIEFCLL